MSGTRIIDTRANFADKKFFRNLRTFASSKKFHKTDIKEVLERSWTSGVAKIILFGRNLDSSKSGLNETKRDGGLFCSVGCDRCYSGEFDTDIVKPEDYLKALENIKTENKTKVIAVSSAMNSIITTIMILTIIQKKIK
ncbi:uncharacterized protein LOC114333207 [Diabrotica virgifera virgifera]|uniref:Uncharacterized protein LOC114333207 n=1 Tax=Diabrotica virgifera virgifera TaxID=50390 RepID=A0A6P7FR82_DIAVI|nr:uncharacterized protein LOC114333207 [Diabrotica virgifera virgifera]XP_050513963.1 uncharacterized protein LOC114333207 [Diabrotica virgifera virgifera]XP_050513966.1 uncharacterized protein LOC114333207 [Diabrotica virgifera virgifera]